MSPIVTTARIVCKDKEARVRALAAFHKIIEFSEPNEPDVLRYAVTLPVDDTTGTVLYMIEEYASQAASDSHLATQPVKDLIELFTTGDVLAGAPEVSTLPIALNKVAKSPLTVSSNPAIILANLGYNPGTITNALPTWKKIVDHAEKNEPGTSSYTVLADVESGKGSEVRVVEVYESWEYLDNVHMKSPAVEELIRNKGDRTGVMEVVKVKFVDGFLGRGKLGKL